MSDVGDDFSSSSAVCFAQPFAGVLYAGGAAAEQGVGGATGRRRSAVKADGAPVVVGADVRGGRGGGLEAEAVGAPARARSVTVTVTAAGASAAGGWLVPVTAAGFERRHHDSHFPGPPLHLTFWRRPVFHITARTAAVARITTPPTTPPTMPPTLLPEPEKSERVGK